MSTHLCITLRWLGDRFHGFIEGTESIEWPPSPFRLFQALLASAHRHGMSESRRAALAWIERQTVAPELLAMADPAIGAPFDHWVPDNDNLVDHRKGSIRKFNPILHGDQPVVHYVWPIPPTDDPPIDALDDLAATIGWFGWAVDSAYATASLATVELMDSVLLSGNQLSRFTPIAQTTRTDNSLRVAKRGTTAELERLHNVNRIAFSDQSMRHKRKWPKVFDRVLYKSTERPIGRPVAVFKMIDANEDAYRHPHAKLIHVAAMVRHLAIERMKADPPHWIDESDEWINRFVRGKRSESAADDHQQFSYVPLPSIGHEHADALIRNVMVIAPLGMERELAHLAERLNGEVLEPEYHADFCAADSAPSIFGRIELQKFNPPSGKFIRECYLNTSTVWQTVTPVILDGHNKKSKSDKLEAIARETEKLIRKALSRAGIETPCSFTWQSYPYLKHCLSAHKYDRNGRHSGYHRPKHLDHLTAVHVSLTFTHPVSGPITIGAGRHCGLGLMAIPLSDR
jgi:CRISPR-associated protein Csb2